MKAQLLRTRAGFRDLAVFWSGPGRPQITAAMQDVIRSAAQQSGGRIISTSAREQANLKGNVSVRARIEGPLSTLQGVLSAIEACRPKLFQDTLEVTVPDGGSTPSRPQQMSFELSVTGYLADDAAR